MRYICSYSGGKDSTATVILAHEKGEPLDEIIFVEVMFSLAKNISGEHPAHIEFIRNVAKPTFEKWGYPVRILRAETDYIHHFFSVVQHPVKYPEHAGMFRGFPMNKMCAIKRDCKLKPMERYLRNQSEPFTQYVGICADEPVRLNALRAQPGRISLLDKYCYGQEDALELCEQYGLLSPVYELTRRGGCWFCPNAKEAELHCLYRSNRDLWDRFVVLEKCENLACNRWNVFREPLSSYDYRFRNDYTV